MPLAKGWKPFKLELKGSKLYFYKPPGDRAHAIKELFPVGLVPPTDEEEEEASAPLATLAEDHPRKGKGRDDSHVVAPLGRKKRAYWGRRTHPDLIRDAAGVIEKGTFEALTHEAVFATTFLAAAAPVLLSEDADAAQAPPLEDELSRKTRWHEFASSVIFGVPSIVGPADLRGRVYALLLVSRQRRRRRGARRG